MTRMKNRVERIEKEITEMKRKMEEMNRQVIKMNQEMNNIIGGIKTNVESLNEYLRELRDTSSGKEMEIRQGPNRSRSITFLLTSTTRNTHTTSLGDKKVVGGEKVTLREKR